jgi:hypothetical protein
MRMLESVLSGCAPREGTRRFVARLPQKTYPAFYREGQAARALPRGMDTDVRWGAARSPC